VCVASSFIPIVNNLSWFTARKRNKRRRKRNATRRANRGPDLPGTVALNILEHADVVQDKSISADDFPHAASAFAGKNDKVDVQKFTGRGISCVPSSTVLLDDITVGESLAQLDPNCAAMVPTLITNHGYRYITNDIR
jgi:hypothetical protein